MHFNKVKGQTKDWAKICAIYIFDQEFVSRIC